MPLVRRGTDPMQAAYCRGIAMPHGPFDVARWTLWQQIASAISAGLTAALSGLGIHAYIAKARADREARDQARLNAAVQLAVDAAMVNAEHRIMQLVVEGAKTEQASFAELMDHTRELRTWSSTHEGSDQTQFGDLNDQMEKLRDGQTRTHRILAEINETLKLRQAKMENLEHTVGRVEGQTETILRLMGGKPQS
jgi:hypothetical protein